MGILDNLKNTILGYKGQTPPLFSNVLPQNPDGLIGSNLDLDGKTPDKYLDNPPK